MRSQIPIPESARIALSTIFTLSGYLRSVVIPRNPQNFWLFGVRWIREGCRTSSFDKGKGFFASLLPLCVGSEDTVVSQVKKE